MKQTIFFFFLFLPFVYAIDCSKIPNQQFCQDIINSNLTNGDKDTMIAASLVNNSERPDFNLVQQWNTNISFTSPPDGTIIQNSGQIHDAWMKIVSLMPSVYENQLLSPGYGKLLTAYNYNIEMPSGTMFGDCQTNYYQATNNANLNIYLNDNFIDNSQLTLFNTDKDMQFNAVLAITSVIGRQHYHNQRYICYDDGANIRYCNKCSYYNTDYITDSLQLTDNLTAAYYNNSPRINFTILNNYNGAVLSNLDSLESTSYSITTDNAYYEKSFYSYWLDYTTQPYKVLQLHATPFNDSFIRNFNEYTINDSYNLVLPNSAICKIQSYSYFANYSADYNLTSFNLNLTIATDKMNYLDNETITVDLYPKNVMMDVQYGNSTLPAMNTVTFTAAYPNNKIVVRFGNSKSEHLINVQQQDNLFFILNFGVFSGLCCGAYAVMRKYASVFL